LLAPTCLANQTLAVTHRNMPTIIRPDLTHDALLDRVYIRPCYTVPRQSAIVTAPMTLSLAYSCY